MCGWQHAIEALPEHLKPPSVVDGPSADKDSQDACVPSSWYSVLHYDNFTNCCTSLQLSLFCGCIDQSCWWFCWKFKACVSGVTRVGDTRGGNWGCHPSIFFLKNLATVFAHSCHYRFLLLSLWCHPSRGCHPTPFFTCPTSFLHYSL